MGSPISRRARVLILLLGGTLLLAAWVGWRVARDPEIPFLTRDAAAEWILFPAAPSTGVRPGAARETMFRASFDLASVPARATLRARCFHDGDATLNDTPLDFACAGPSRWKRTGAGDVARALRPGTNVVTVRVRSRFGPPALWLSIEGPGIRVATGPDWVAGRTGSSWRAARLATTPMDRWEVRRPGGTSGTPTVADPTVLEAAGRSLPLWIAFAGGCGALLLGMRRVLKGRSIPPILAGLTALLWSVLIASNLWFGWNDQPGAPPTFGFDRSAHLKYIDYILERGALPLADEGWEMYQPPLYYLMGSGLLRLFGQATSDREATALLRVLNWAGGLLLLGSLYESLRLLHPREGRPLLRGFVLGAFLPVQLYMTHYVGNEIWSAALASAAIAVALRILVRSPDSTPLHLLLGALMGAALLTKFSTLVVVAVIVAVLLGHRVVERGSSATVGLRTLGGMLGVCAAVCGWHFLRVALRFGNPLIGNWDPRILIWWQDPGYHTAGYYTGFGAALHRPIFSGFHSFADAMYSTLWGDGMIGGSAFVDIRPPWDLGSMTAGYLLAILPTVAILAGVAATLVQLVRVPRAEGWLVLGLLGATAYGVFYMTLRLPFYGQAKAFYGLSAFVPLAVLGSRGLDVLARRLPAAHAVLDVLLGVWAANAVVSFWIRP